MGIIKIGTNLFAISLIIITKVFLYLNNQNIVKYFIGPHLDGECRLGVIKAYKHIANLEFCGVTRV